MLCRGQTLAEEGHRYRLRRLAKTLRTRPMPHQHRVTTATLRKLLLDHTLVHHVQHRRIHQQRHSCNHLPRMLFPHPWQTSRWSQSSQITRDRSRAKVNPGAGQIHNKALSWAQATTAQTRARARLLHGPSVGKDIQVLARIVQEVLVLLPSRVQVPIVGIVECHLRPPPLASRSIGVALSRTVRPVPTASG
jgi:hypothetical protein